MFYEHLALMILLNLFQLVTDQQILWFERQILLLQSTVLVQQLSLVNLNNLFYLLILQSFLRNKILVQLDLILSLLLLLLCDLAELSLEV